MVRRYRRESGVFFSPMDPVRDLDELLNIEGDPEDVLRALLNVEPCDTAGDPATGDEAIDRMIED